MRHAAWILLCFLIVLWWVPGAQAHEKWFVDSSQHPLRFDADAWKRTAAAAAASAIVLGLAWVLERLWRRRPMRVTPADRANTKSALRHLLAWIPLILAVHAAVPLLIAGVQRQLFVPNLMLPRTFLGGVLALTEIVIALGFVYGMLTRVAAVALVSLFPIGAIVFGPVEILEHGHLLGIALFLFIIGRGPFSFDGLTDVPRPRVRGWIPAALPLLRILTGCSIAWVGLTEKLWNVPLGIAFLERHPFNFMPALGFGGFSNTDFVVSAGMMEIVLGVVIASGLLTRLVIVAAWVPFNLSLPFLGWVELVGHLPIYGIMAVLLLWGSGRDVIPYIRELEKPAAAT